MLDRDEQTDANSNRDQLHPLAANAKALLKLAEAERRKAEEAFAKLDFETQLATALKLEGDELQEWLMLSTDCTELVRALPPERFHQTIRLIGAEDALGLLAAASSEQLQSMMDIEWFTDNKLNKKHVRRWIELLINLNEDEADQALQGMDPNAIVQFLRPHVRSAYGSEMVLLALHVNPDHYFTPDDLRIEDDLCERFLNYLYDVDRDLFKEIFELLFLEDPETVKADMYGGREDRLLKRGFPTLAAAEYILEPVDLRIYDIRWPSRISRDPSHSPRETAQALKEVRPQNPFLMHVLALGRSRGDLGDRTERAFIKETTDLANSLMIAHTRDSGDAELRKEAMIAVQVLVSLGLEATANENVFKAIELLKKMDSFELFRIGWTISQTVSKDALDVICSPLIHEAGLPDELQWLPGSVAKSIQQARELMGWRKMAKLVKPEDGGRPEIVTWPLLCRYTLAIEYAKEYLHKLVPAH